MLRIQLFGSLDVRVNGAPLPGLRHREGERLFAYLVLHEGVEVSYRTLAERFWPAEAHRNPEGQGDFPNTRQAVHNLRQALGEEASRLQSKGKGVVCLDLTDAEVDVLAFDRLAQTEAPASWKQAVALYRAPLLADWPESWVAEARDRRRREYRRMVQRLLEAAQARQDFAEAEEILLRAIGADPREENWWRARIEMLAQQGRYEAVEAVYRELCALCHRQHRTPEKETEALLARTREAAQQPPPEARRLHLEPVGGAVSLESRLYITRLADEEFHAAIARHDSIVLVKGARQTGKTSLLARGIQPARKSGARIVLTDFQAFSEADLGSADALFLALANMLALQLELPVLPRKVWDADLSASMNLEWFLRRQALDALSAPLVWCMDEVDRLFTCSFGSTVFGLFRSWHNRRALDPEGPWSRLTLAIGYATEAHLFITDLNQSPFNVGTRLVLEDFDREQVAELNRRYNEPLRHEEELTRFYRLVGGQPYLVQRGLYEMRANDLDLDELETEANRDEGPFGDHLRRLLVALTRHAEPAGVVRDILRGGSCPTEEHFHRLRSAGILIGDSVRCARLRCQLYASYLKRHLP